MQKKTALAAFALPTAALLTLTACGSDGDSHEDIGRELTDDFIQGLSDGDAELARGVACPSIADQMDQVMSLTEAEGISGVTIDEYGEPVSEEGEENSFTFPIEVTTQFDNGNEDFSEPLTFDIENVDGEWCIANMG